MKLNAGLLLEMPEADAIARMKESSKFSEFADLPFLWETVKGNISVFSDVEKWADILRGDIAIETDDEDKDYLAAALNSLPGGDYSEETWSAWTSELKSSTGRKGRGLFMPLRKALTGEERGPEMNRVLVLLGEDRARARLQSAVS